MVFWAIFGIIKCSISRGFRGPCPLIPTRALPWTCWKVLSAPKVQAVQYNDLWSLHVVKLLHSASFFFAIIVYAISFLLSVSAQRSRIPSRFRILIVGAKPRHSAKPPLGKLRLPKLLVPTQKYCTTTSQEFFPRQTTWKMNMQDEDSLRYEFFILLSTQQHF